MKIIGFHVSNTGASAGQPLQLHAVQIHLPGRTLVDGLDLQVAPGEVVTVMGASGSGKSSLLGFIGGFLAAPFRASGQVRVGDVDLTRLPPHQRGAGLLFQDDLLFAHLSVAGNLLFGLPADVRGRAARQALVDQALANAGLAGLGGRDPATLSGGQRARVALLRTLLARPRLLLLDEPFSALDTALRQDFRAFVFDHARRAGLPTLLVTHDAADAAAAGGRVLTIGPAPKPDNRA